MPSTYAHYRLGKEVRKELDETEKNIVEAYPELFLIGLHGPDILFYYHPLTDNRVNRIGYKIHARPGREFFESALQVVRRNSGKNVYLAYLYGFLCHFALDETCHGYIDEKIAASGISHTEIEAEFDRMLMAVDGFDPVRHRLTGHIVPSMENTKVIQAFFEGADSRQVQKALKGMIFYNNLLVAPSKGKRFLINALLKVTGNYREMHGLMINYEANPKCDDSTRNLYALYQEAKNLAVSLIHEYREYLEGQADFNPIYDYTFGSRLIENEERKNAV